MPFFKKTTCVTADRELLWRYVLRALPVILIASLITTLGHNLGWTRAFENTTLDFLIKVNPLSSRDVFVVRIEDADYKKLFRARSPLNSDRLASLIKAILAGNPKVIVVDIDTADDCFARLNLPSSTTKIIWTRAARPLPASDPVNGNGSRLSSEKTIFMLDRVLGKSEHEPKPLWGAAILPQDASDGVVRYYYRHIYARESQSSQVKLAPTVEWAATQAFRSGQTDSESADCEKMILISTGGSKYLLHYSAGNVLSISSRAGWRELVKGKVVLLGGFYSQDRYVTSAGRMEGVEIIAEGIESELERGGVRSLNDGLLVAGQMLAGILAVLLSYRFGRRWILLINVIVITTSALMFSIVSFSALYLWVDFVPVLVALQLHNSLSERRHTKAQEEEIKQTPEEFQRQTEEIDFSSTIKLRTVCLLCGREFDDGQTNVCPYDSTELSRIRDDDLVGSIIAERYEILGLLGQGGMSTVYKARHCLLESIVAIKVLHPNREADKECVMRFYQEAKATAVLSHPNVISATDFGITPEGKLYLVLNYVDGQSLKDFILKNGPLNESEAVRLFLQMCNGLSYAHGQNILHRDLKPSNIMLVKQEQDKSPQVKIVDFGLAKILSSDLRITSTGLVFGSPLYMSPEQCLGRKVDQRSDIYSLGCIMYECLAGHPPFTAEGMLELFRMHAEIAPPPLNSATGVSSQLSQIILKALAKQPDERFATALDFEAKLLAAQLKQPGEKPPADGC